MKIRLFASFLLMLTFVACANNPDIATTPQTKVARLGGDLLGAVQVVQRATADLQAQRVIGEAEAAKAMVVYGQIGALGKKLASALTAYDGATDVLTKNNIGRDVVSTLEAIDGLVVSSLVPISSEPARAQLSGLLQNVTKIILAIRAQVPDLAVAQ